MFRKCISLKQPECKYKIWMLTMICCMVVSPEQNAQRASQISDYMYLKILSSAASRILLWGNSAAITLANC